MNLKGKVAIVTGASRGIGLVIAQVLAQRGVNLVCASTKQETCDAVAKKLTKDYGIDAIGIQVDVSDFDSSQNLVKKAMEHFGTIDICINNAGITRDNLLLRMKQDEWNDVINTNLSSVFNVTKAVIRPMLKNRKGRIINVSSVVGLIGNAGQANYAAAKAGLLGFTKSIAKEFGGKGITCNAVAPGFIDTDMVESLPKEYIDNIISEVPLKRLGNPEEIANLIAFLASDLSSYITGEVIAVDGGVQL
jgi:3-oxoacyl-[acyl-carrier protein] reductase